jgi:hypothetical protein
MPSARQRRPRAVIGDVPAWIGDQILGVRDYIAGPRTACEY